MASQSIEQFKKYLEIQKDDFLQDGRRVEGIIRDLFPEEKTLISLLTSAWKAGVVAELRQTGNPEVTIAQFGDRLCQEYGLRESSALSAVRVWAYALRIIDVVPNINVSSTPSFIGQPGITAETKKCPFCAEEVKKDARKCKHCHSDISDDAMVKGVQINELVRQAEALNREQQKLERERQEIEKRAVQEARQNKLEQQRRKLEEKKKQLGRAASPAYSTTNEIGRDGRFIAYNDGTVIDTKTNLMWAAKDNGSDINWSNAKSYCDNYQGGSYTDWRMPTMDELKSLYDKTRIVKYLISTTPFQGGVHLADCIDLTGTYVWSSNAIGSESVFLYFLDGKLLKDEPKSSKLMRALPVRAYIVDGGDELFPKSIRMLADEHGNTSDDVTVTVCSDAINLEFKMKKGEETRYKYTVDSDQFTTENDEKPDMKSHLEMVMLQKCNDLAADGSMNIDVIIESGSLTIDGQEEPLPNAGQIISMTMKKNGEIVTTSESMPLTVPHFPSKAIKTKDTWQGTGTINIPGLAAPITLNNDYILWNFNKTAGYECAEIRGCCPETRFTLPEGVNLIFSSTETTFFSHKEGMLIKTEAKSKSDIVAPNNEVVTTYNKVCVELVNKKSLHGDKLGEAPDNATDLGVQNEKKLATQWAETQPPLETVSNIDITKERGSQKNEFTNSLGMKFVLIHAGTFWMGSPSNEPERSDSETQHQVTISHSFYMQTTEVTQGQWKAVMGNNPSSFNGADNLPVEKVSWDDVREFIRKLSSMEGSNKYRLPTEAQWEYAARAGSTTAYCFGNGEDNLGKYAWYKRNSGILLLRKTHSVAQKKPNIWGLYDMHGNVWEWVHDWYGDYHPRSVTDPEGPSSGSKRVMRGGSFDHSASACRSACRSHDAPESRRILRGFRLVRTI